MGDFKPMSSLDEDQFTSGDRRGPVDSARKSAATKPRSRAHARVNRFPMRFYLIAAVSVVLLQCHPVASSSTPAPGTKCDRCPKPAVFSGTITGPNGWAHYNMCWTHLEGCSP